MPSDTYTTTYLAENDKQYIVVSPLSETVSDSGFACKVIVVLDDETVESNYAQFTPPETATITMSDADFDWDGGSEYSLGYQATVRINNRILGNVIKAALSINSQTFGADVETKTVNGQGGTYTFNISRTFVESNFPATQVGDTYTLTLQVKDETDNKTLNTETATLTIAEL